MEAWKQGTTRPLAILSFLLILTVTVTVTVTAGSIAEAPVDGSWFAEAPDEGGDVSNETAPTFVPFLLKESEVVTKTEAGEIRLFRGSVWNGQPARMHVVIATMEPNSMLIPHYMDADLIVFLQIGEMKIGYIHKDDLVERKLKPGGVLRIPAGSTFYFINTRRDIRLRIIASIAPVNADSLNFFFTSGGVSPPSLFNGFDISTLTSAFNVTAEEIGKLTSANYNGSIIFITCKEDHLVTIAMKLVAEKLKNIRRLAQDDYEKMKKKKRKWASILSSFFFGEDATHKIDAVESSHAYNVFEHRPGFRNNYGWSIEVNKHDYSALKKSDISVFLINLTAGSMMAPHVNTKATEYAVVTAGSGTVQVVYPNGTSALKANVSEGDVFWVPRFYPFCEVAAKEGPMEIVGFTTSAKKSGTQFLVGRSSILRSMVGKEVAPAFGFKEEEFRRLVAKQVESRILPG